MMMGAGKRGASESPEDGIPIPESQIEARRAEVDGAAQKVADARRAMERAMREDLTGADE